ncbi:MAG TPA: carbohydrate ABC transporter permease [Lachnospiraceae bacterium]
MKTCLKALKYVGLVLWAFICLFPLYWLFTFSLKNNDEIFGENILGLPKHWLIENYSTAFAGGNVGIYLKNSIVVTVVTILFTAIVSITACYAIERMDWKLKKAARILLMTGLMIPIHAALLPVFYILQTFHLLNTSWALILPYTGFAIPMGLMIVSGFMNGIPRELEEAACIDGAGIYQIFFRVIFPLMRPALATVAIFTFLQAWNELMFATVYISDANQRTLTVGIQSMSGQFQTSWGPIGAALVVATIPTLLIYFALNKQVQESLVMGAVKG